MEHRSSSEAENLDILRNILMYKFFYLHSILLHSYVLLNFIGKKR